MVVFDSDFEQARYGGVDGVVEARIESRGGVVFDVNGTQELAGGVFDLTSALVAPAFQGQASLAKIGSGRLNLTGDNGYTGTTTIEEGTLGIIDVGQLSPAAIIFGNGAALPSTAPVLAVDLGGAGSATLSQEIQSARADVTVDVESGTLTLDGDISQQAGTSQALVKQGEGTLLLAGANALTGGARIEDGTLGITDVDQLGAGDLSFGGGPAGALPVLRYSGGSGTYAGDVGLDGTDGAFDVRSGTLTLSGAISQSGGAQLLAKRGAGTMLLTGTSSHSGGTRIEDGVLGITAGGQLGTGTLTFTPEDGAAVPVLRYTGAGTSTFAGDVDLSGTDGTFDVRGGTLRLSGDVTEAGGPQAFAKLGAGTLLLAGGASAHSGGTRIEDGVLGITDADQLGTGILTFTPEDAAAVPVLRYTGAGASTFSADVDLDGTDGTFDVRSGTLTLAGDVTEAAGAQALVKQGAGTLLLDGINGHTGGTRIEDGTLGILDTAQLGTGRLTFGGGAAGADPVLFHEGALDGTFAQDVLLDGATGTVDIDSATLTFAGDISQSGGVQGLTKRGGGTLVLEGASAFTGTTRIEDGTLAVASGAQLGGGLAFGGGAAGALPLLRYDGGATGQAGDVLLDGTDGTIEVVSGELTLSGAITQAGGAQALVKQGAGTLALAGTATHSGGTTIEDGTLAITDGGQLGTGRLAFDGAGPGALPVLRYAGGDSTFARRVLMSGSDATIDVESGSLALTGDLAESGGTFDLVKLGAGTLVLGSGSAAISAVGAPAMFAGFLDVQDGQVTVFDPAAVGGSGMRIGDATVLMGTAFEGDAAQAIEVTGDASLEGLARTQSFVQNGAMTAAAGDSLALRTIDFTLQGDASAFLGTLEVEGASFTMVNGNIGGDVEVRGGSLFDATGNVAGGLDIRGSTLRNTGSDPLAPSRLDVAGDLSLDGASTMVANVFLDLEAPGSTVRQSDRVVVAGDAAKSGHLTAFWNQQNTPAGDLIPDRGQSRSWTVLTSAGGSGSFTSAELDVFDPHTGDVTSIVLPINASDTNALVRYTTVFNATEATITLTGIAALPPDQVFDTICGPITGAQIDEIINELIRVEDNGTADASLVAALILLQDAEAIEPSYVATQQRNPYAAPDVVLDSNAMAGRVAMLRLMQVRDGELGSAASKAADTNGTRATDVAAASQRGFGAPLNGPTPDEGARPWMRGYGFYEDVDEQDCAECGYDAAIGAAMVGIDWTVDGGGIVGAFAGLGPGQITLTGPYGGQVEDLVQVLAGVYGSVVPGDGAAYLQGFALGAYGDIDRTRNVEIPTVQRAATSGNESWSLTVGGEVGLNLEVSERTVLQPFAGVAWGQYWGEGYTETGAGSLNLTVQDQSANEWLPTAGARLMHAFREGSDVLTPFIGAAFVAQLPVGAGWAPTYTSDFDLGEQRQLQSGPPDRYGVSFQAGLELAKVNGVTAYAAFDGAVLTGKQRFGGQVGVLVPF